MAAVVPLPHRRRIPLAVSRRSESPERDYDSLVFDLTPLPPLHARESHNHHHHHPNNNITVNLHNNGNGESQYTRPAAAAPAPSYSSSSSEVKSNQETKRRQVYIREHQDIDDEEEDKEEATVIPKVNRKRKVPSAPSVNEPKILKVDIRRGGGAAADIDGTNEDYVSIPFECIEVPGVHDLPERIQAAEMKARSTKDWCFMCKYTEHANTSGGDVIWGGRYKCLQQFISNNRHLVSLPTLCIGVQERYDRDIRYQIPDKEDKGRYWSIEMICMHLLKHDRSYRNQLENTVAQSTEYVQRMLQNSVIQQHKRTKETRMDMRAAASLLAYQKQYMKWQLELDQLRTRT
jgi:hypothetical protein